jgi:hypothetical protein
MQKNDFLFINFKILLQSFDKDKWNKTNVGIFQGVKP